MEKLDSGEIIKLLDTLIGETEAVGVTGYDEKIEKNLMTLIDVADWCIDRVAKARQKTEQNGLCG